MTGPPDPDEISAPLVPLSRSDYDSFQYGSFQYDSGPPQPEVSVPAPPLPARPVRAIQAGNWRRFFGDWLNNLLLSTGSQIALAALAFLDTPAAFQTDPATGWFRGEAFDSWFTRDPITGEGGLNRDAVPIEVQRFVAIVFLLWLIGWVFAKVLLDIWGASRWGGKVGHLATSLRIADHQTSEPATPLQIRKRGIAELVLTLLIPLGLLVRLADSYSVLFNDDRRRFVDWIAGTRIVEFVD